MKRKHIIVGVVSLALMLFILGDYLALFGTHKSAKLDFVQMDFKTVDEETGAMVEGAHARCFQKQNNNACSEVSSGKPGVLSLKVPVHKIITRSLLFEKDEQMVATADPGLHIMFIHQDYANPVETFDTSELPALSGQLITVTLPKSVFKSGTDADNP